MEHWRALDGEIPCDPPGLPWHSSLGDPPSKIIARMRKVWDLVGAGTPEYAQALFNKAGAWIDYWLAARDAGGANIRAGVRDANSPDSDDEIATAAIFAIYAARQAVLSGRYDLLAYAREIGEQVSSAGRAIEQQTWRRKGGKSRKKKRAPIGMAIEALARTLDTTDVDKILEEMRLDANVDGYGDSDSEAMSDIRSHASRPIDVRFQEVPTRLPGESRDEFLRRDICFVANGLESSIKVSRLNNILTEVRKASRVA